MENAISFQSLFLFPSPAESRLILGMDEELPRSGVP